MGTLRLPLENLMGGVPQGTVSGPIDLILYINDLVTLVPMYKYVDDTTIFEVCLENEPSAFRSPSML